MKKIKWSVNKIISFLLLSSCVLVGLIAGVFSFKNANVSSQNGTSIEQIESNLKQNYLSKGEMFLAPSKRDVVVYHYNGEWSEISSNEETFKNTVVYFKSVPDKGQDITSQLKDFYVLDVQGNAVSGNFYAGETRTTNGTNIIDVNFIPKNTLAYSEESFSVAYSCLYDELYFYENLFYSDVNHTVSVALDNNAQNLASGGTIYIVKGTWGINKTYNRIFTIKAYSGFTGTLINVNGSVNLSNITIDGQGSNATLINIPSSKTLNLTNVIIQNNNGIAINNAGTVNLKETTIKNISVSNKSPIVLSSGSTLNIGDSDATENDCTLTNLSGIDGGAIYSSGAILNIVNSTISNCSASGQGGAIYYANNNAGNKFIIKDSTIENCKASQAGAIFLNNARLHLTSNKNRTSIINNITADSSDKHADIEVRGDNSVVYLSGDLNIESSIGILVNQTIWGDTSPLQLIDYLNTNTLLSSDSKINVKIINPERNLLNKSALVSCSEWVSGYSSSMPEINSRLQKVVKLVNKSITYKLRTTDDFAGLRLGWFDSNSTIYFDPANGSDASLGDTSATAVKSWDKVLRSTNANITVKLLSTWYISNEISSLDGTNFGSDTSEKGNPSELPKKIAKIVRQGFNEHMLNVTKDLTLTNIVLDGNNISTKASILFSESSASITINLGTEFINNKLSSKDVLAGSAIHIYNDNASLTINSGTYFNNTASETKNFEIYAVAKKIIATGLNLNESNYGSAYLVSKGSKGLISNSEFINSKVGLVVENADVKNITIKNRNQDDDNFGLILSGTSTIYVEDSQISSSGTAFSSLNEETSTLDITDTILQNNKRLVAGNSFNAGLEAKLIINLNQNLTINSATSRQIHTTGSITSSGVITISNCSGGVSGTFGIITAGSLNFTGTVTAQNNSTRPLSATGNVTIGNGNFVYNHHSLGEGGAIYSGGKVTITNGNFYNNSASGNGGAISSAGATTITKGNFYNNTSLVSGGAIYSGSVDITSGNFYYNIAKNGGAIYTSGLKPGSTNFKNNHATENGGAVYINYATTIQFLNSANYENNFATNGGFLYAKNILDSTPINIVLSSNSIYTNNVATSGNGGVICGDSYTSISISSGTFTKNNANGNGGVISTAKDVSITSGTFYSNKATSHGGVIYANAISITGGSFGDATNGGNTAAYGAVTSSVVSTTITGSSFIKNKASTDGGVAYGGKGSITVSNSTFSNNQAANGGVLYVQLDSTSGSIQVLSGTFNNNKATNKGGVIYGYQVDIDGGIYIQNVSSAENSGAGEGGVIYVSYNLDVDGTSTYFGTNSSSEQKGNYASKGGAIYSLGATTIDGATFKYNKATNGGAIYFASTGFDLTIGSGTYENNQASSSGGVVYNSSKSATLKGTYKYNKAVDGGVAYGNSSSTTIILQAGTYMNNHATTRGGVVYTVGNIEVSGSPTVDTNKAPNGGAIFVNSSSATVSLKNGTFKNNYATTSGSVIQAENCTVTFGTASKLSIEDNNKIGSSAKTSANVRVKIAIIGSYASILASLGVPASDTLANAPLQFNSSNSNYINIKLTGNDAVGKYLAKSLTTTSYYSYRESEDKWSGSWYTDGPDVNNHSLWNTYSGGSGKSDNHYTYWGTDIFDANFSSSTTSTSAEILAYNKVFNYSLLAGCSVSVSKTARSSLFDCYWDRKETYSNYYVKLNATASNGSDTTGTEPTFNAGNGTTSPTAGNATNITINTPVNPENIIACENLILNTSATGESLGLSNDKKSYTFGSLEEIKNFLEFVNVLDVRFNTLKITIAQDNTVLSGVNFNSKVHVVLNGKRVNVGANVSNIIFDGTDDSSDGTGVSGVVITSSSKLTFTNCEFINFTSNVISGANGNIDFTNCNIYGNNSTILQNVNNVTFTNCYVQTNVAGAINIGVSYEVSFSGGTLNLSGAPAGGTETNYVITCSKFNMSNGTLIISGKVISTNAGMHITGGNIISNNAVIDGNVTINGTADINISGDALTANKFTLSGKIISTASLSGDIIIQSLNTSSALIISVNTNVVGEKIATINDNNSYWAKLLRAYYNNQPLCLKRVGNDIIIESEEAPEVDESVYFFDPLGTTNLDYTALGGVQIKTFNLTTFAGKTVYLVSTWTLSSTTIDCNFTLTRWSGFNDVMVKASNSTIKNVTFNDNGINGAGHVINVTSGTLTLSNVTIFNRNSNTSAINASSASLVTINGGKYYNNVITGDGESTGNGAVLIAKNINIDANAIFSNNSAVNGGAIYINSGTTRNINGQFSNNHASGDGGAIYVKGNTLTLSGAKFTANYAVGNGGAIYLNGTTLNINKNESIVNEFNNNHAKNGGAIYSNSDITIDVGIFTGNTASAAEDGTGGKGGVIYSTAGNISINDAAFNENVATTSGGVIYSTTSGTITITEGDFNNNTSVSGAFAYVENSTFNIKGGDIYNNLASGNGGIIYSGTGSNLTLGACNIYNNTNNASASLGTLFGGIIWYGYWNGIFTFSENCNIYDNKINSTFPNISGGVIYLDCFKTATFEGTIKNNIVNASKYCTGLAVFSGSEIKLSKCNIINNKIGVPKNSTDTTNIECLIYCKQKLTISNSEIYGNETDSYIVYNLNDDLVINNTKITKNTTKYKAIVKSNSSLIISNSKIISNQAKTILEATEMSIQSSSISGNTLEEGNSNAVVIYSTKGFTIKDSNISGNNFNAGTLYLVTDTNQTVTFTSTIDKEIYGNNTTNQAVIVNNNHVLNIEGYNIQFNVNLAEDGKGGAIYLGKMATGNTKLTDVTFVDNWAENGGSIYIVQNNQAFKLNVSGGANYSETIVSDIAMTGAIYIANGIKFDLLAGSIFDTVHVTNGVIYNLGTLTIKDVEFGNNDVSTFDSNVVENGVIYNNGNVTIENAIFIGNFAYENGGAIYNRENGQVLLAYSQLKGNEAKNGGAIYNEGIFNIASALINGSSASEKGGVIYSSGNLSISTCQVVEDEDSLIQAQNGGFIYNASGATFVINGGTFSNAIATQDGGFIYNKGTFVMNKGELSNNSATNGGAIYNAGNVTINYGEFKTNDATMGSSIFISSGRLNIFDGVISDHASSNEAIYAESGSIVNVKNADFKNNDTTNGVIVLVGSQLYILDSLFESNSTGGAINASVSSLITIKRTIFKGNDTNTNGGAISLINSSLSVQDSNFDTNTATENGGAIYANGSQVYVEEVEFAYNTALQNGGTIYVLGTSGEIYDSQFISNRATKGSAIHFAENTNFIVDGGIVDGQGMTLNDQGAIYILSTAGKIELGNITIQNNFTTNKAGLYISAEESNTALVTLFSGVNFVNNNLYYMGGSLHIKASSAVNFDDVSYLYLSNNANRSIIEPGLKVGSNIVVRFQSETDRYIGSYKESKNTKAYITSNDVKYVKYSDASGKEFASYLSIDTTDNTRNVINFREIDDRILDVIVSSKVITIDGSEHRLEKSDFRVYYRGKDNLLDESDYYIFFSKNAIDLTNTPAIDEENGRSYGNSFSDVLNVSGKYLYSKTDYIDDIFPLMQKLLGVSEICPGYRETNINTINYLVVYLNEHDNVVDSKFFTGSTTLSIVERNLTLEENPVATLSQVADVILLNNAIFTGGLVTSDGYAVSGTWAITNSEGQSYSKDDVYIPGNQYYAKFSPYASNLFGTQYVLCKVDIQVNYSNLYYYIDTSGNDYFALSDGISKEEINITLQEAVDMIQNNGNIYFLNTYSKTADETTLNINKTINFISKEAPVFNIEKGQSLSINVGVGGLYFYNYQNKCERIIENAGNLTLGAGVNICNQTKNAILNSGTLSLNGCKIYANIISTSDSSIIKNNGGTVFVNGGDFFNNVGENGSLIYSVSGYVYINGGEIYGNTAKNGGAIYMDGGTLILNGGKIRHNTAENGSAFYAINSCSVNQNGTEMILNKSNDGSPIAIELSDELQPAVYILNNKIVTAEQLMTSAKVGNLSTIQETNKSEKIEVLTVITIALIYVVLGVVGLEITKKLFYKNKNKIIKK